MKWWKLWICMPEYGFLNGRFVQAGRRGVSWVVTAFWMNESIPPVTWRAKLWPRPTRVVLYYTSAQGLIFKSIIWSTIQQQGYMGLTSSVHNSGKQEPQDSVDMALYNLPYDLLLNISQYLSVREIHALQLVSHILGWCHTTNLKIAPNTAILSGPSRFYILITPLQFRRHAKLYMNSRSHGPSIENSHSLCLAVAVPYLWQVSSVSLT